MLIGELKKLIADLPDDAVILAHGSDGCLQLAWSGNFERGTGNVGIEGDYVVDEEDTDEHHVFVHGLTVNTVDN